MNTERQPWWEPAYDDIRAVETAGCCNPVKPCTYHEGMMDGLEMGLVEGGENHPAEYDLDDPQPWWMAFAALAAALIAMAALVMMLVWGTNSVITTIRGTGGIDGDIGTVCDKTITGWQCIGPAPYLGDD